MSKYSELECFHSVVEQGSFIAAANKLGITNSAVSASVKKLENRLNVRLLERSTRVVRTTQEGQDFFQQSKAAINQLEKSFDKVKESSQSLSGTIRIGAPTDLAQTRLLTVLSKFNTLHGSIRFQVNTSDSVEDLYQGDIDLAIRYGFPNDSRLIARPLSSKLRVLCASPTFIEQNESINHPSQLATLDCICYKVRDAVDNNWTFYDANGEPLKVTVNATFCTDDSSLAREWAAMGKGLVYKSGVDVYEDLESGKLKSVLNNFKGQDSPLNVIYPSAHYQSRRIKEFINFLIDYQW